jgi:hypothetical protein
MKSYARIDGGQVVEIFQTGGNITEMFHPSLVWVDITNINPQPQEGWSYNGTNFTAPPVPTLSQAQATQLALLQADEAAAEIGGFLSSASGTDMWYDSDSNTQAKFSNLYIDAVGGVMATKVYATGVPVGQVPVRCKPLQTSPDSAKTVLYLTSVQVIQLITDLRTMIATAEAHLWTQEAAVYAATTVAGVQAITW